MGVTVLDKFMETYPTYSDADADGQAKLKAAAFEAWMAAVFLRGSNQSIYGELMRDYRKDFANQDDNYPKSVRAMVDVMRQLKPNKKKTRNTGNTKGNNGKPGEKDEPKKGILKGWIG